MFWDKWIPRKYLVKSEVFVVEVYFEDQQPEYHFTHLKNTNNKVAVLDVFTSNELRLPAFVLKNKIPLVLIVNGKGVIIKKTDLKESSGKNLEEIITANLPALNVNDFYIQVYKQENETGFISLCRRNIVDTLLEQFSQQEREIADLFVGSASVIGLQPLWSKFNTLELSHHRVELTNGFLDLISTETNSDEKPLIIEDIALSKNHVLGFATGVAYFMQRKLADSSASFL
ncbi:MAG: hypothetical protein JNL60_10355, partial [Bacteroidia bacterium]|nr:hypothetical protein [Bacteroidia bacterium]